LTALKAVKTPIFNSTDGSCDNFALEVHLKVMFKPIEKSTMAAFEVTKVIVDIVYGKYVPITKVTQV